MCLFISFLSLIWINGVDRLFWLALFISYNSGTYKNLSDVKKMIKSTQSAITVWSIVISHHILYLWPENEHSVSILMSLAYWTWKHYQLCQKHDKRYTLAIYIIWNCFSSFKGNSISWKCTKCVSVNWCMVKYIAFAYFWQV